jgi:hypothetical protein
MFRSLIALGAGWFIYTKTGRHTAKNIFLNSIPYIEKEIGIKIMEPLRKLTKEVK